MREANNSGAGPDLVPFRIKLPRETLRAAKKMAAQAGADPAIVLGALLTRALASVASPEIAAQIVASVRADMGRDDD